VLLDGESNEDDELREMVWLEFPTSEDELIEEDSIELLDETSFSLRSSVMACSPHPKRDNARIHESLFKSFTFTPLCIVQMLL